MQGISSAVIALHNAGGVNTNIAYGSRPGYVHEHPEQDAQEAAKQEGVTLHRNPDGSHEAVDETKLPKSETND